MGVIEGNRPCSDNDWEKITKGGDDSIKEWIAGQIDGKSCVVVLIGSDTAGRKWISYEIERGWTDKKGLVGIYVHNLLDSHQNPSPKGGNPFNYLTFRNTNKKLSSTVKAYDPPYTDSRHVYDYIKTNLNAWVEEAISIRNNA